MYACRKESETERAKRSADTAREGRKARDGGRREKGGCMGGRASLQRKRDEWKGK